MSLLDEFDCLLNDLSKWLTGAEEDFMKLATSVVSMVTNSRHMLQECQSYYNELSRKRHDLDELAGSLQRLRHNGIATAQCLAQCNQMNARHSALLHKIKVTFGGRDDFNVVLLLMCCIIFGQ